VIDKKYLKQKIIIISIIGLVILFIGNFLPMIKLSSKTLDYDKTFQFFRYEGKYIIILAIISFLLLLFKEAKASIFPMIVVSILLGYLIINRTSIYNDCSFYEQMFSWGPGLYVLVLGNVLSYVAPIGTFLKEKISIKITRK
jgi:hypothetical protein